MSVFQDYSKYYDLLYQDKKYDKEVFYLDKLMKIFHPNVQKILDLGCGTGKHARLFAEKGYIVHGVELSERMLAYARVQNSNNLIRLSQGDIRTIRIRESFDAVTALFHVINYQVTNKDLKQVFETAATHLSDHGLFVFDIWHGPAVVKHKPSVRVKQIENDQEFVTRLAVPTLLEDQHTVNVEFSLFVQDKKTGEIQTLKEHHMMRYLFREEIAALCTEFNFDLVWFVEWMSSKQPDDSSWSVCVVCKKR